jgi:hypothetical protein
VWNVTISLCWVSYKKNKKEVFTSVISVSKMAVKTLKMTNTPLRPCTSIIDENAKKVKKKWLWMITIREVADEVGISIGSCHNILSNCLAMKRVTENTLRNCWISSLLVRKFLGHKQYHSNASTSIFTR